MRRRRRRKIAQYAKPSFAHLLGTSGVAQAETAARHTGEAVKTTGRGQRGREAHPRPVSRTNRSLKKDPPAHFSTRRVRHPSVLGYAKSHWSSSRQHSDLTQVVHWRTLDLYIIYIVTSCAATSTHREAIDESNMNLPFTCTQRCNCAIIAAAPRGRQAPCSRAQPWLESAQ